jgi:hypothetical protein
MSELLWTWWDFALTAEQRELLLDMGSCEPSPEFALQLWRGSGAVAVVEPDTWSVDADPNRWRLTAEVRDFLGMRQYERRLSGGG